MRRLSDVCGCFAGHPIRQLKKASFARIAYRGIASILIANIVCNKKFHVSVDLLAELNECDNSREAFGGFDTGDHASFTCVW